MSAPSWLDAAFVQRALRCGGDENARVQTIAVRPASADGENYICTLYRVTAVTADDTAARSLVVKCPMVGGVTEEYCRQARYYADEVYMYSKAMPAVEALLETASPGRFTPLVPRCLYIENETIVLEDLTQLGFQLVEKTIGLDADHAVLALRTLARFHGASIKILTESPELLCDLTNPLEAPNTAAFETLLASNVAAMVEEVRSWAHFPPAQQLAGRLEAAGRVVFPRARAVLQPQPGGINALVHGDLWPTNILFRYQGTRPVQVRFVDLQLSHVNSPAVDLLMFRLLSLRLDAWHQWPRLLEEYHRELKVVLKHVGGPPAPTVQQIDAELHRCRAWSVLVVSNWLPVARAAPGKKLDIEGVFEGKGNQRAAFSEELKRWLRLILQYFEESGTFED